MRGIVLHFKEPLERLRFFFERWKSCAYSLMVGISALWASYFWKGSTRNLKEYVHL